MKRLLMILLAMMLCISAASAENSVYYIDGGTADRVHLREEASTASASLGLYFTGTSVIVIDWYDEWAWVMIGDVTGHMMAKFLTREEPAMAGPWYVVDNPHSTWANLHMSPAVEGLIAMCPDNGTAVRLLGETADGWSCVECGGVMGYIKTNLLSPMEEAEAIQRTTILAQEGVGRYIHQYIAPNGKPVYFTAELREPYITFEDVNFDGWEDIVIVTMTSAKSTAYKFFVYDVIQDEFVYVQHTDYEGGLINYEAYPQYGLIGTHASNGNAGLLHVTSLYRWEGNTLKLIRSAISDEWSEEIFEGHTYTSIIHGDILHITVRDHTRAYDESVLWELIIPETDTEYRDVFTEEMDALWQGIK